VQEMTRGRFYSVLGLLPDWIYFSLTPSGRELGKHIQTLRSFTMKVITGIYRSSVQIKFDVSFLQVLRDRKQQIENAKTDEEIEETIDDSDESKMSARK
jgi:hypothetical protein